MGGATKTALVVDDSIVMREMVCFVLESAGYRPLAAEDGPQALMMAVQFPVELVITDYHLPGMDGIEFIRAIRQIGPCAGIPIVVLTTEHSDELKELGRGAGAAAWLVKPFNPETLMRIVKKVS